MTRRLGVLSAVVLALGCSGGGNSLTGSESQVYDLSFDSIVIVLQGDVVFIKYVGSNGDPAILVVNTADIVNVANSTIDLTQLDSGQPRGTLENVNGGGDGVTNDAPHSSAEPSSSTRCPSIGATLSGQFNTTLTDGYTLNGNFSGTVNAP